MRRLRAARPARAPAQQRVPRDQGRHPRPVHVHPAGHARGPRRLAHAKKRSVGVRIPDHAVAQAIVRALGEPILSSSLLMPGHDWPMTEGWQIKEELDHELDAVVDAGDCGTTPTTVVDWTSDSPEVVREGAGDPDRFR
nr:Sua5/YciO/YrdC/YwlC family protein [Cellulomonas sp. PSBB021]